MKILRQPSSLKELLSRACDDKILNDVFGIKDRAYFEDKYGNPLICERSFYNERFKYEDNSSLSEFWQKFQILIELINVKSSSNKAFAIGVLKAVIEVATRIYSEKFYTKWQGSINCEDKILLVDTIAPHIGDVVVDDKYFEVGEITSYYIYKQWFEHNSFFVGYDEIRNAIKNSIERKSRDSFKASLLETEAIEDTDALTINDVDVMNGIQFEKFVGKLFAGQGYLITYTPVTGDQGVDLIAEKDGIRVGIQAKRYTGRINNSAIQEIVAGKIHHLCDNAMVVTNSYFTKSAIDLAVSNNVILWDRALLKDKLSEKQL